MLYENPKATGISQSETLKVISLNIERGKQMDKVVLQLRKLDPDIILLQEVDYFSRRGGRIDQAKELARILNMNSFWVCEINIRDKCTMPDSMDCEHLGCEGNAVLSKYPLITAEAIILQCQQWLQPGHRNFKSHAQALVVVDVPNRSPVVACSAHLEPHFTGVHGRARQYSELVSKIIPYLKKYPTVVGGDFNTVCTGIGRFNIPKLSPNLFQAFSSFGKSEAEQFQENSVEKENVNIRNQCGSVAVLTDPFDKSKDTSFTGMSGLFTAKLDWCLMSQHFRPTAFRVGNKPEDHCSDHMWIYTELAWDL